MVGLKDMIVLETRSNTVRERLFTEKDLELGKADKIWRSAEQAHKQVYEMTAESRDEAALDANVRTFGQEYAEYQTATSNSTATTREDRIFLLHSMCLRAWYVRYVRSFQQGKPEAKHGN
jgi:hypothetical protein